MQRFWLSTGIIYFYLSKVSPIRWRELSYCWISSTTGNIFNVWVNVFVLAFKASSIHVSILLVLYINMVIVGLRSYIYIYIFSLSLSPTFVNFLMMKILSFSQNMKMIIDQLEIFRASFKCSKVYVCQISSWLVLSKWPR